MANRSRLIGKNGKRLTAAQMVIDSLEDGDTVETAAAKGGITSKTVRRWLARGVDAMSYHDETGEYRSEDDQHYAAWARDYLRAEAKIKSTIWGYAVRHAEDDGRLAMQVLDKRWPAEYGDGRMRQHLDDVVRTVRDTLGDDAAELVFAAIGGQAAGRD